MELILFLFSSSHDLIQKKPLCFFLSKQIRSPFPSMIWIKLGWKLGNHWLFPDEKEVHSFLENKFYCHIIAQFFVLRNLDSEVFQFGDKSFTGPRPFEKLKLILIKAPYVWGVSEVGVSSVDHDSIVKYQVASWPNGPSSRASGLLGLYYYVFTFYI